MKVKSWWWLHPILKLYEKKVKCIPLGYLQFYISKCTFHNEPFLKCHSLHKYVFCPKENKNTIPNFYTWPSAMILGLTIHKNKKSAQKIKFLAHLQLIKFNKSCRKKIIFHFFSRLLLFYIFLKFNIYWKKYKIIFFEGKFIILCSFNHKIYNICIFIAITYIYQDIWCNSIFMLK